MGRDKASLRLPRPGVGPRMADTAPPDESAEGRGGPGADRPPTLAERTAELLSRSCSPALEVGPGHTRLPVVAEHPPGQGPLAAVAAGWEALHAGGWQGPVVVVATDLPNLTVEMLAWLTGRGGDRSVVPVVAGRVQPLCARYSPADLDIATSLVAGGHRAMTALIDATDPELVPETEWLAAAGGPEVLLDVDTPEDVRRVTGR